MKKFLLLVASLLILTSCNNFKSHEMTGGEKIGVEVNNRSGEISNTVIPKSTESLSANYLVKDGKYNDQGIIIEYPQITNLDQLDRQMKINELLKSEALIVLDFYENTKNVSLEIKYKISLKTNKILSVQFYGIGYEKGAAYPLNLLYTVNINMSDGTKFRLRDVVNIDKNFIDIIKNSGAKKLDNNQAYVSAFEYIINTYSLEDLIRYLDGADSSYENSAFTFSYFTEDSLGISIEVPHTVGDHLEIEMKYETIKGNLIKNNGIWIGGSSL